MCDKDTCNDASCCGECEPWNCLEQQINDALATKEGQLQGYVDEAKDAAAESKASAEASAQSAAESKEFRDEAETAASTAVAAEGVVLGVANTLQDTADKLEQIADELGTAIAGVAVSSWFYTTVSENQTVIPVPANKNAVDVQSIYIEGARQSPFRGFEFDKTAMIITLAEPLPLGLEIEIILGTYNSDNPNDFAHTLASNNGASLVGTARGITVQQTIDELNRSFQDGGVLRSLNDTLLDKSTIPYQEYVWSGDSSTLPKVVPAGSTPATTGGVGIGAWLSVGDASLRSNLASSEDGKGDSLLCVKQPFTNSSSRTQHDKNFDRVSILDFLGVKGDGVTDCTAGIQFAANYSKLSGKAIHLPAGNYLTKDSISVSVGDHYSKNGVVFIGDGKGSTRITKDTVGTINATYNAIFLVDEGYNFTLKGIMLYDQTEESYGVVFTSWFSGFYADDFYTFVTHTGVLAVGDFFINSVTNGMLDGGKNGFYMAASGTTNQFDGLFAAGQSGYGYRLAGGYSRIGALACDGNKGLPYYFSNFTGSIGSLGAENPDDHRQDGIAHFTGSSHVTIDKIDTYGIHLKDAASFITVDGSSVSIDELVITGGQNTGYLYNAISGYLSIGIDMPSGFTLTANSTTAVVKVTGRYGDDTRHFKNINMDMTWIGRYDLAGVSHSTAWPKAIHMNSYGQPKRAGSDGSVNNDYAVKPNRGDIFLENNPAVNPSVGYIILNPGSGSLQDATYASIPIRIGGTTAERPVTPPQTTMYFDTTLGKPVWYYGTGWVDATGASV